MDVDIQEIVKIARGAGKIILEIYNNNFEVYRKKDDSRKEGFSVLTEADTRANKFIIDSLRKIYLNIPIISEESKNIPFEERKDWEYFWLVDPLDRTKDFIKKNGEFTVNIALIKKGTTILGVVYAPARDILYYGDKNGSFKKIGVKKPERLPLTRSQDDVYKIVASRGSFNKETENFIENLKKKQPKIELINIGSSMKFCLVAEGKANIYPRLGETSEWDAAAAHAVVKFAGKNVYAYNSYKELEYNKENLLNPWIIVK